MDNIELKIIEYIKSYGQKGKLPSFDGKLSDYYSQYLDKAYEWCVEKLGYNAVNGFAYFKHLFEIYVVQNFKISKRGLIYVERSIDLDTSNGFDNLNFSSVGECWSWRRNNSQSYCADFSFLNNNITRVILCGYVHPESVDWLETVYLNSYDMKNETEIRMNNDALVECSYIKIHGEKYSLGGSYLLNASADKYKHDVSESIKINLNDIKEMVLECIDKIINKKG